MLFPCNKLLVLTRPAPFSVRERVRLCCSSYAPEHVMFGFGTKNQDKQGPIAEEIENLANTIRNSEVVELSKGNEYANSVANDARDRVKGTLSVVVSEIITSPILLAATSLASGALAFGVYRRYFQRIDTAAYMTPSTMKWRRMLVGKCTSVGDADGFRLYHTPGPPVYRNMLYGNIGKKSHPPNSKTISVRLAGADAPELAHFGKPAQPFAKEAKEELQKIVLGKTVWCQVRRKIETALLVSRTCHKRSHILINTSDW